MQRYSSVPEPVVKPSALHSAVTMLVDCPEMANTHMMSSMTAARRTRHGRTVVGGIRRFAERQRVSSEAAAVGIHSVHRVAVGVVAI